jgi:DNA mismatch repair protein MutS2
LGYGAAGLLFCARVAQKFAIGDLVQTPFGKGLVREARNNGRFLVDVGGRAMVIPEADISPLDVRKRKAASAAPIASSSDQQSAAKSHAEIDLHGLTVEEALARAEEALNDALIADCAELRIIHGRSGGRIRTALHRRLREISSVRGFGIDPRNPGVTIVKL